MDLSQYSPVIIPDQADEIRISVAHIIKQLFSDDEILPDHRKTVCISGLNLLYTFRTNRTNIYRRNIIQYWSKNALNYYDSDVFIRRENLDFYHIYPAIDIYDELRDFDVIEESKLIEILKKCFGCMITREDRLRLRETINEFDSRIRNPHIDVSLPEQDLKGWDVFRAAGIEVYNMVNLKPFLGPDSQ